MRTAGAGLCPRAEGRSTAHESGLEGRSITAAVLRNYYNQAEQASGDLERFIVFVKQLKSMCTVH